MDTNQIHPSAFIDETVQLGTGNIIGPFSVILGKTKIGNNNWIGPHVVIGTPPEDRNIHNYKHLSGQVDGSISIGSRNIIHEHTSIQNPTLALTEIGNDNFIMHNVHIAHDNKIGNFVTLAPGVALAGHVKINNYATLGLGVVVHQFRKIGLLAMIVMNAAVTKDVPNFILAAGSPSRNLKVNLIGIQRQGFQIASWCSELNKPVEEWDSHLVPAEFFKFTLMNDSFSENPDRK